MTKYDMQNCRSYGMRTDSCRRCGTQTRPLTEDPCPGCNQPNQYGCPECGWKSEIQYHSDDPRVLDKAVILAIIKNRR